MANWNQQQPAPKALKKLLKTTFPEIPSKVPDGSGGTMINYQISAGGGGRNIAGTNTPSDHNEGRAIDIFLHVGIPPEKHIANYLFATFIKCAKQLEMKNIIWNRQVWSQTSGQITNYTRSNPHTNHIHISWARQGSQNIRFGNLPILLILRTGFNWKLTKDVHKSNFSVDMCGVR